MNELDKSSTILLLSSDGNTVNVIKNILFELGYKKVRPMENGIEAISEINKGPCDFIICDMSVKFISGLALIKEVKVSERIKNMPAMLIGNEKAPASEEELKQYGIVGYLKGPFKANDIENLIRSTLFLFNTSGTIESKFTDAKEALINNETEEAIDRFSELHSLTKNGSRASIGLSESYIQAADYEKAAEVITSINDSEDLSPSIIATQVKVLLQQNRAEEAVASVRKILEQQIANIPYYLAKFLRMFMNHKVLDFSNEICKIGITKKYQIPDFSLNLGKIHYFKSDFQTTLTILQQCEDTFGLSNDLLNVRGVCYKKLHNFELAIQSYEKALELTPMDAKIYFNLASCSIAMKDYAQAIKYLESCTEIAPNMKNAVDKLAELKDFIQKAG